MKVYTFIYIVSNLIILQLVSLESTVVNNFLYTFCGLGILTIGIAHGSLDNILFGVKTKKSNRLFISIYVLLIFAFIGLWLLSANAAFIAFLVVSAYHFGQSQLDDYYLNGTYLSKFIYVLWGGLVLLLPLVFNQTELLSIENSFLDYIPIITTLIINAISILKIVSLLLVLCLVFLAIQIKWSLKNIIKEAYILILIALSFKILPPFIAFSLFFVFIHSFKVITQEYQYCQNISKINSIKQFIILCLPLTMISVFGAGAIVAILYFLGTPGLIPFSLLVILSSITFPHSIVMEKFYRILN